MYRKFALIAFAAIFASIPLSGCNVGSEDERIIISVTSINGGAPLAADVYNLGEDEVPSGDDFIPEDWVTVTFVSKGYNSIVSVKDFLVTGYTVNWRRVDGGPALPAAMVVEGATSVLVEPGNLAGASILLVPFIVKTLPEISVLLGGGEILTIAEITFVGHDVGSGNDRTFHTQLSVNFGDFADVD